MSIRTATVERKTAETSVKLILNLDGNGHGVMTRASASLTICSTS